MKLKLLRMKLRNVPLGPGTELASYAQKVLTYTQEMTMISQTQRNASREAY